MMMKEGSSPEEIKVEMKEGKQQEDLSSSEPVLLEASAKGELRSEEEDEEDEKEDEGEVGIQLGFVEKDPKNVLFLDPDWRNWDGGKVGGLPVRVVFDEVTL